MDNKCGLNSRQEWWHSCIWGYVREIHACVESETHHYTNLYAFHKFLQLLHFSLAFVSSSGHRVLLHFHSCLYYILFSASFFFPAKVFIRLDIRDQTQITKPVKPWAKPNYNKWATNPNWETLTTKGKTSTAASLSRSWKDRTHVVHGHRIFTAFRYYRWISPPFTGPHWNF